MKPILVNRILAITALAMAILAANDAYAAERTVTLKLDNLFCASCPYIVKKVLAGVPGVRDVKVSFKNKTALVTFDDGKASVAALTAATTNVGFPSMLLATN